MNTWTCRCAGDTCCNQTDYVAIIRRFNNVVTQTRTYPGADCASEHVPVITNIRIKLKNIEKTKRQTKYRCKFTE